MQFNLIPDEFKKNTSWCNLNKFNSWFQNCKACSTKALQWSPQCPPPCPGRSCGGPPQLPAPPLTWYRISQPARLTGTRTARSGPSRGCWWPTGGRSPSGCSGPARRWGSGVWASTVIRTGGIYTGRYRGISFYMINSKLFIIKKLTVSFGIN